MPYLTPEIIARAARGLFKTADSHFFAFLSLKASGINEKTPFVVHSSPDDVDDQVFYFLAGQPKGFSDLVETNLELFQPNDVGLPISPQGQNEAGSIYSLFFPLTDKVRYLLRKSDSWRSVIWTAMDKIISKQQVRTGANLDKGDKSKIYMGEKIGEGSGAYINLRLATDYVEAVRWNMAVEQGKTLHVPLKELAIWLHRNEILPADATIQQLVYETVHRLHLTPLEVDALFDPSTAVALTPADFVEQRDL